MKRLYEFQCPFCNQITTLELEEEALNAWAEGESVQKCFPELSDEEREIIASGLCPECQEVVFADDEPYDCDLEAGFDMYAGCYDFDC